VRVRELVLEHHVDVDAEAVPEVGKRVVEQPARVRSPREFDDLHVSPARRRPSTSFRS